MRREPNTPLDAYDYGRAKVGHSFGDCCPNLWGSSPFRIHCRLGSAEDMRRTLFRPLSRRSVLLCVDGGKPRGDAIAQMGMGTFCARLAFGRDSISIAVWDRKVSGIK